jgi:hypothetical protein
VKPGLPPVNTYGGNHLEAAAAIFDGNIADPGFRRDTELIYV